MSKATSPLKLSASVAAAAVAIFLGANAALAQSKPDTVNGRYALSPIADGVLRLDTRTGAVSTCNNSGAGWACYAVPDERAAFDTEIGRLQADNERLKAQLAERDGLVHVVLGPRAELAMLLERVVARFAGHDDERHVLERGLPRPRLRV